RLVGNNPSLILVRDYHRFTLPVKGSGTIGRLEYLAKLSPISRNGPTKLLVCWHLCRQPLGNRSVRPSRAMNIWHCSPICRFVTFGRFPNSSASRLRRNGSSALRSA